MKYGEDPVLVGRFPSVAVDWKEFMHYLYLPVVMPFSSGAHEVHRIITPRLPRRLRFVMQFLPFVITDAIDAGRDVEEDYIYVTARRGYATPDNPLNRPGWHCDGFGTDDLNYVWCDGSTTQVATQDFTDIDPDHAKSMEQFEDQIRGQCVWSIKEHALYRFNPYVVHCTPDIPPPGEMRSFLKISLSRHPYNLEGNSHNHHFNYEWKMHSRSDARNDPAYGAADYLPTS